MQTKQTIHVPITKCVPITVKCDGQYFWWVSGAKLDHSYVARVLQQVEELLSNLAPLAHQKVCTPHFTVVGTHFVMGT